MNYKTSSYISFFTLLFFCLFAFQACEEAAHPVVTQFEEMQSHQQSLEFTQLEPYLDARSTKFVTDLFEAQSVDDYLELGNRYNLPYFFAEYYRWNYDFPQHANFENFISFLNLLQFSFFDLKYQFTPIEKQGKLRDNNYYLPVGYNFHSVNKLRWLRFNDEGGKNYKYDLIYSLKQNENHIKELFDSNFTSKPDPRKPETFRMLYESLPLLQRDMKIEKMTFEEHRRQREQG